MWWSIISGINYKMLLSRLKPTRSLAFDRAFSHRLANRRHFDLSSGLHLTKICKNFLYCNNCKWSRNSFWDSGDVNSYHTSTSNASFLFRMSLCALALDVERQVEKSGMFKRQNLGPFGSHYHSSRNDRWPFWDWGHIQFAMTQN